MKSKIIWAGCFVVIVVMGMSVFLIQKNDQKDSMEIISVQQEIAVAYEETWEDYTLEDLQRMNSGEAEIIYSASSEYVREIGGVFTNQLIWDDEDVLLALMNVRSLMGIQDDSFCCESVTEEENGQKIFLLYQLYEGVTVEDGLFRIVAAGDGIPVRIRGEYVRDIFIDTEPQITAKEGLSKMKLSLKQKAESARLVIKTIDSQNLLCWKYTITNKNDIAEDKAIYVDAMTGEIVLTSSLTVS